MKIHSPGIWGRKYILLNISRILYKNECLKKIPDKAPNRNWTKAHYREVVLGNGLFGRKTIFHWIRKCWEQLLLKYVFFAIYICWVCPIFLSFVVAECQLCGNGIKERERERRHLARLGERPFSTGEKGSNLKWWNWGWGTLCYSDSLWGCPSWATLWVFVLIIFVVTVEERRFASTWFFC